MKTTSPSANYRCYQKFSSKFYIISYIILCQVNCHRSVDFGKATDKDKNKINLFINQWHIYSKLKITEDIN